MTEHTDRIPLEQTRQVVRLSCMYCGNDMGHILVKDNLGIADIQCTNCEVKES